MKTKLNITVAALAALLACSACAERSSQSANLALKPGQLSPVAWDELVAAIQVARTGNQFLIFQR